MNKTIDFKTIIDVDKCTGCKSCFNVCPGLCFEIKDKKATVVNQENCYGCRACIIHCKDLAVFIAEPGSCYISA